MEISENEYFISYLRQQEAIISIDNLRQGARETKIKETVEALALAEKLRAKIIIILNYLEFVGFISIENKTNAPQPYFQDDFVLLDFLGDKLESTVRNISLYAQANTDNLTKLSNQRYLEKRSREEITRSMREGTPISFMMIDGDKFKEFNDLVGGHDFGDEVLSEISSCIESVTRSSEECFRYGGEEFGVLARLYEPEAKKLAERINRAFKTNTKILELEKRANGKKISVSIGVATFLPGETNKYPNINQTTEIFSVLKKRADKALYQAKKQGRDRVVTTKTFNSLTFGKKIDDFVFDIAIIANDQNYKNLKLQNDTISLVKSFNDEKVKYCDAVIFDNPDEENRFEAIDKFNEALRGEKYIGVVIKNISDKQICDQKNYHFLFILSLKRTWNNGFLTLK